MSAGTASRVRQMNSASSDPELVAQCLSGSEAAWAALIAKYRKLIYSIPIRSGFAQEEAADIFQSVCLDLFCRLSSLRDPQALAGWLIEVTRNKCFHWHRDNARYQGNDSDPEEPSNPSQEVLEQILCEVDRDQRVRTAVCELNPRCRILVEKLFFELPARPYREVARELGLAVGSVGMIRSRCLEHLRDRLEELGVC